MYKHLSRNCQQVSRMTTQEKLIEGLFQAFPNESETAIAKRCGLSIARFSNYKHGKRDMDVDAVIGCAQALGWDVRKAVADHLQETAHSPREKALWRKFAATAAGIALAFGLLPSPEAHASTGMASNDPTTLCIMRNIGWHDFLVLQ